MQMLLTFFSKNISIYAKFNDHSFNNTLTNNIVSFEQRFLFSGFMYTMQTQPEQKIQTVDETIQIIISALHCPHFELISWSYYKVSPNGQQLVIGLAIIWPWHFCYYNSLFIDTQHVEI